MLLTTAEVATLEQTEADSLVWKRWGIAVLLRYSRVTRMKTDAWTLPETPSLHRNRYWSSRERLTAHHTRPEIRNACAECLSEDEWRAATVFIRSTAPNGTALKRYL